KAGAAQTLVASQQRWALMTETPGQEELDLAWLVSRMDASKLDHAQDAMQMILIMRVKKLYKPTQHKSYPFSMYCSHAFGGEQRFI
ncbi:molybdopterin-guanine dinucleotide biosynthesis protein MobB, partial [Salmonella enterica subsp. enterica serovar Anatum]|nr:molybdopterin-guanine dinucleotide biosynthesis protein MobB [Salmonella enterica subsp. enterica serovar Anatum]